VDLVDGALEVYREPHFDGYASTKILHEGESASPAQFPDAVIEVAQNCCGVDKLGLRSKDASWIVNLFILTLNG
jgi:hypothetical protein